MEWARGGANLKLFLFFSITEAEFLDVIGKKVLRVFLLAIHIHLY
jgi:hypothetical protein